MAISGSLNYKGFLHHSGSLLRHGFLFVIGSFNFNGFLHHYCFSGLRRVMNYSELRFVVRSGHRKSLELPPVGVEIDEE